MSKIGFVVLAHRNPAQLQRLSALLPGDRTFVHLDAGIESGLFARLISAASLAQLLPRHRSAWASWGIVQAIMEGFRSALAVPTVSHVAVLSGQDYPLVPISYMESLLPEGRSFMLARPLPLSFYGRRGGLDRLEYMNWSIRGRRIRLPARRRLPGGLQAHAGSPWSIFARSHIESALTMASADSAWWRRTWIPDELFLATVLGSLHPHELLNANPGYTEWMPRSPHPRTFGIEDVELLASIADQMTKQPPGRKWFARKFDDENGRVLESLMASLQNVQLRGKPLEAAQRPSPPDHA